MKSRHHRCECPQFEMPLQHLDSVLKVSYGPISVVAGLYGLAAAAPPPMSTLEL